ncbi:cytochrome c/c1 heme-lyase [Podospora aff. communis PSN243]|uniref:Holocytochrome c-type synthase n=1 Tax=Podospora aff. communis PSN243 TaxID=3040156 RepID=A0AAV9GD05_9PEZI|nr:cytochrome c/c1 heme-lyase [Podospora aff. communis PSN243]
MQTTDLLDTVLVTHDSSAFIGNAASRAIPPATMKDTSASTSAAEAKCPVDHKTREAWLQQARSAAPPETHPASSMPPAAAKPQSPPPTSSSGSWSSWLRLPSFSRQPQQSPSPSPASTTLTLDESREISTIPRSSNPGPSSCPAPTPANNEQETGASASGNWIYPSEKMFFEAMKRKGHAAAASDMKTVVPIHNAVNERAWAEILRWEAPFATKECGGPRLHSFAGESKRMTPKARMNTLLGYTAPFDRHDWVVDRCGTQVEYVIDFYAGRNDGQGAGKLNFYLDVRPKLNTWEGVKMRAMKAAGLS